MQYERELPDLDGDVGVGATLGPYELLVPIARGGMASVWAARLKGPRGFQKLVALKVMLPVLSDDPRFEKMFLAEAEYASRIRHPNVASIVDLGEQDGRLFIAMEWVDGEPLNAIRHVAGAEAGFVPVPLAVRIAVDAAMGLHAAHELTGARGENLGLVHCDVSPQNILVTFDGLVKVVDFGLAKATAVARTSHEEEALIGGKLSYMSPEQASGATVDRRTDIFALGIVVYEMITGRHPYQAETALATLQRIRDDAAPIPTPAELCAECPSAVSDAIMSALDRDPARRFPTMLTFGRTLERALGAMPGGRRRDDLACFVTNALGERARRRRAAIADATRDDDAPPPRTAPIPPPRSGDEAAALAPPPPPSSQPRAWTEDRDAVEPLERLPASTAPMAMSERPPPRRRIAAFAAAAIGLAVLGLGGAAAMRLATGSGTDAPSAAAAFVPAPPPPAPAPVEAPAAHPEPVAPATNVPEPTIDDQAAPGDAAPITTAAPAKAKPRKSTRPPRSAPPRAQPRPGYSVPAPALRDPGF